MSYDVRLKDRQTDETALMPAEHYMTGGTYAAEFVNGEWTPKPIREAELNITYNYSSYYYEATENDDRFAHKEVSAYYADGTIGPIKVEYGLRGLNNKTGRESIAMIQNVIDRILAKYKPNNEWLPAKRTKTECRNKAGNLINEWDAVVYNIPYTKTESSYWLANGEGPCDDYWMSTAGNALKPLYQMLTMAKDCPSAIWEII